jgi:hypothetical protein
MNWGRHLTPWTKHLLSWNRTVDEQKRISVHYNTYIQYHPGYLALKEKMVEDSVETGIKSQEPEGMRCCRDSESHTAAMVITTVRPHRSGRDNTRNDG